MIGAGARACLLTLCLLASACQSQEAPKPKQPLRSKAPASTVGDSKDSKASRSRPVKTSGRPRGSAVQRSTPAGTSQYPVRALGKHGAVAAQEGKAAAIGLAVLKEGGNAVDAAIAVSFALAVTHPSAGNLGGGGFMVIHMADARQAAIDYREVAPLRASRDMYLDKQGNPSDASLVGALAAGIPGTVAGLALAHRRFGTLPWKRLVSPAIVLAEKGQQLDTFHADDLRYGSKRMLQDRRTRASARYYQPGKAKHFKAGDRWFQPELARTLRAIEQRGAAGFYTGPIAKQLVAGVQQGGGIWQLRDLAGYRAKERKVISFPYRGHTVLSMPPPSSGGVALRQILRARELLPGNAGWRSLQERHHFLESERRAFADRNKLLADSDYVQVPLKKLLSINYIDARMKNISAQGASSSTKINAGLQLPKPQRRRAPSEETTHFSVIDADGNAVATTTTLNTGFGSKFVVPKTGVLLNNEMDDFAAAPGRANAYGLVQGEANAIAPKKRMLSSMTPTILLDDQGRVRAVVGSPGGPTIISTVAQILIAIVEHKVPIDQAVAAPRVHHQWLPDRVFAEESVKASLVKGLRSLGHTVQKRGPMGHANCIEVDRTTQGFRAVADVQRDGGAAVAY